MPRIAVIEKDKCHPAGCGGFLCIRVSPGNRMGNEVFVEGEDGKAHVNEENCTDAESITAKKCPFGAIHMIKLPEKLTTRPIHRFGKDGFILYGLPIPVFGRVVGVLGVNGVGKTTAIKVLAGVQQPNLGTDDTKDIDELIGLFKGTEAQLYFEKMKSGEMTVAYKPQQVDLIPKTAKGTVRDLLSKIDTSEAVRVAEKLDIAKNLDNDVSSLSGGELQRMAIAATVLKKANVYIFDEPTSYLDIKQRLKVSSFIRDLADEKTAVLVVEHDLIILDNISDVTHIMYGESGAYGIVSVQKQTRAAINTYLSGYIREDNMRFRDHAIKFDSRPPSKQVRGDTLLTWTGISKKMGAFSVRATKGDVVKKHVIGVLGENGTGKTTFMRILAQDLEADSGEVSEKIMVSHKPQYLSTTSDELVASYLGERAEKLRNQVILPLEIEHLMLRKLKELSGGELQRVAIGKCLSTEADLYLLDEPSAYLDAEQRMKVSRMLRDRMEMSGKTAVVIDHDLLLIDYIADDLLVFKGEPARSGIVEGPYPMDQGMNTFLADLDISLRRDVESNRPRINKVDSQMDRKQKSEGKLYYSA